MFLYTQIDIFMQKSFKIKYAGTQRKESVRSERLDTPLVFHFLLIIINKYRNRIAQ